VLSSGRAKYGTSNCSVQGCCTVGGGGAPAGLSAAAVTSIIKTAVEGSGLLRWMKSGNARDNHLVRDVMWLSRWWPRAREKFVHPMGAVAGACSLPAQKGRQRIGLFPAKYWVLVSYALRKQMTAVQVFKLYGCHLNAIPLSYLEDSENHIGAIPHQDIVAPVQYPNVTTRNQPNLILQTS